MILAAPLRSSAARVALRSTRLLLQLFRANYSCDGGARPLGVHLNRRTRRAGALEKASLARNKCRSSLVLRSAAREALDLTGAEPATANTCQPRLAPASAHLRRLNFSRTRKRRCSSAPSASCGMHWLCPIHRPARSKRNTTSRGNATLSRHNRTGCQPRARQNTCQPRTSRRRPTTACSWVNRIRRGMAQPAWAIQAATTEKESQSGNGLAHTASHASTWQPR